METKILKYLMFACLIAGVSSAFAQNSLLEKLVPGSCSQMSKNPKCWESQDHTHSARQDFCMSNSSCGVIKSVHQDSSGSYHCIATDGHKFACHKLVEEFGSNLEGVSVKITTPYFDRCHIPGGCGSHGCGPGYGVASLDPFCQ